MNPIMLENNYWQVGILADTGASIAFGRVRYSGTWLDVMRPTDPAHYNNNSLTASFVMMPWANRVRDGRLTFRGHSYQLQTMADDGAARHGVVREHPWVVERQSATSVRCRFNSADIDSLNFPFRFSALMEYALEDDAFVWRMSLKNEDRVPFPAGFGHHPYFVRLEGEPEPQLVIPCDSHFELTRFMATDVPVSVPSDLDFRTLRSLDERFFDHLYTDRRGDEPARIVYPGWNIHLLMHADPVFQHLLLYAPQGKPFFALEPQTNANDGFNLYEQGIMGSGVFVLDPGAERNGTVRLRYQQGASKS